MKYRQPGYMRAFRDAFNALGITTPPLVALAYFRALQDSQPPPSTLTSLVIALALAGFYAFTMLLTANFFPDVAVSNDGLEVSFLWRPLRVPWSALVALRPSRRLLRYGGSNWVIATNALTPFHRLYGFLYAFWSHPSFIVPLGLPGQSDLLETIRSKIPGKRPPA